MADSRSCPCSRAKLSESASGGLAAPSAEAEDVDHAAVHAAKPPARSLTGVTSAASSRLAAIADR